MKFIYNCFSDIYLSYICKNFLWSFFFFSISIFLGRVVRSLFLYHNRSFAIFFFNCLTLSCFICSSYILCKHLLQILSATPIPSGGVIPIILNLDLDVFKLLG